MRKIGPFHFPIYHEKWQNGVMERISCFASDNASGEDPRLTQCRMEISEQSLLAYGNDPYTQKSKEIFRNFFGRESEVLFVYGGTGANVIALSAFLKPYQGVICAKSAHINMDECGAPEKFTGSKLFLVETADGKVRVNQIEEILARTRGIVHRVQPSVLSITQPTEMGTIYTLQELDELTSFAKENELAIHMDGARLSNAAASLDVSLEQLVRNVDVVTFGGTKNGLAYGEAVIFFEPRKGMEGAYIQKQAGQLPSKTSLVAWPLAQMLERGIWRENAQHANKMAFHLAEQLKQLPGVRINQPVQSNGLFFSAPSDQIERWKERYDFVLWDPERLEVRFMTSFSTQKKQISDLIHFITSTV